MARRDFEFRADLDDREILEALRRIDKNIDRIANDGDKAFGRVSKSARVSGVQIGLVSGITSRLTDEIINLGRQAVRVFKSMVDESVKTATAFQTTQASLLGIFDGSQEAATQAFDFIRAESRRLGVDLTELAPVFLPKVEDLQQFSQLGELAAGLARLDPLQAQTGGVQIALREALTGELRSLRRRFEIDVKPIQKAQDELGELEGLLVGLQQVLEDRGQDFESLSGTASAQFSIAQERFKDFRAALGEPVVDELSENLERLNGILEENEDDFLLIATAIGDLVASVVDLIGTGINDFLEGIEPEKVEEFILALEDGFDTADLLISTLTDSDFSGLLDRATRFLGILQDAAITAAKISVLLRAERARQEVTGGVWQQRLQTPGERARLEAEGQEAYNEVIRDSIGIFDEYDQRIEENRQRQEERRQEIERGRETETDLADSILGEARADEELADAQEELADAQEKVNEAREEFDIEKQRAELELQLKQERKLLEFQIKAAQEREDIARRNAQRIEDIRRQHAQDLIDAATDLNRDEQDIARDHARDIIDLEQDANLRRQQIETDHRRALQRIRDRFTFDAQEAIRQNDAIAFLRIQRRKEFEIDQAQQQRDDDIQDAERAAEERRQALQTELEREVEDARLANRRKLEDLRVNLQRQLEENQIRFQREIEQQTIAEQRKREALQRSFQQQKQDFDRHWDQRLQDLDRRLAEEEEKIRNHLRRIEQLQAQSVTGGTERTTERTTERLRRRAHALAMQAGRDDLIDRIENADLRELSLIINQLTGVTPSSNTPGRHTGGPVNPRETYLVGKPGAEELFRPSTSGFISPIPNRLMFNPATAGVARSVVNQNSNNRVLQLDYQALADRFSPQQIEIIKQLALQLHLSTF